MSFKLNAIALATLSVLLAACGSDSDNAATTNNSSFYDKGWYDIDVEKFSVNSTNDGININTSYSYDIRANTYNHDKNTNIISYTTQSLVGSTSLTSQKSYTATASQLLTTPASIGSNGIPQSFFISETTNSITEGTYNQENIKSPMFTATFKQKDISNMLISDVMAEQIGSRAFDLSSNPHFLKVKNAALKFPTGSVAIEEAQFEILEKHLFFFNTVSPYATISDYKTATKLNTGESFVDDVWANGSVKSSCVKSASDIRMCVALYDNKVYFASYNAKEVLNAEDLYKYAFLNKTAIDALIKAYKDNFKSETIKTPEAK